MSEDRLNVGTVVVLACGLLVALSPLAYLLSGAFLGWIVVADLFWLVVIALLRLERDKGSGE